MKAQTALKPWEAKGLIRHTPPEGVPITFRLSSLGARLGAQLLDIALSFGGAFAIFMLIAWSGLLSFYGLFTFYGLATFFLRVPYYILSELIWNGRTLGKRILRIRVVSLDGRRLTPHQIVARNIMKEVEVFMPIGAIFTVAALGMIPALLLIAWMIGTLLVPVFNKKNQRLGDMIAGTIVVDNPRPKLMPDLAAQTKATTAPDFAFLPEHLGVYGRYELQALENILRSPPKTAEARLNLRKVAEAIHRRIRLDQPLLQGREWGFLMEFYRQQREFLESRNLFGDTRENKYHAEKPSSEQLAKTPLKKR